MKNGKFTSKMKVFPHICRLRCENEQNMHKMCPNVSKIGDLRPKCTHLPHICWELSEKWLKTPH